MKSRGRTLSMRGLVLATFIAGSRSQEGLKWTVENSNGTYKLPVQVPGTLHLDLLKEGILDQDPLYRDNERRFIWVTEDTWIYRTTVNLTEAGTADDDAQAPWLLQFDSIDTVATVKVNGAVLGEPRSMFVKYSFVVPHDVLSANNENEIEVIIEPALNYTKTMQGLSAYSIPEVRFFQTWPGWAGKNMIRKTSSDFGWDWGPALIPVGILGPVRLVRSSIGLLSDVLVDQDHRADGSVGLTVKTYVTDVPAETPAVIKVELLGAGNLAPITLAASLIPGENTVTTDQIVIPASQVQLWWPVGLGKPHLYKLRVSLSYADGAAGQVKEKNVGLRTVRIVEEPVPESEGLSFYFEVNGVAMFAKGANLIPLHVFYNQATDEEIDWLLQSSVDANMNMVRVWGGGYYQPDQFYDMADEKGLLIWEEIMFACALYPRTADFLDLVKTEVTQQVRRLQSHPSIALWGGNNENEVALTWFEQSTSNRDLFVVDYYELYINTIYKTIQTLDPTRAWVDSSPSNGVIEREPYVKRWGQPGDLRYGDLHHYDFYSDCEVPSSFPNARFISEFGFQSFPSLETYSAVLDKADYNRQAPMVAFRQRHEAGDEQMEYMISLHFKLPPATAASGSVVSQEELFDRYIYLTQIQQSRCYETAISSWRRHKSSPTKTYGTLYWQLNDVWQGPTWSSIEYGGKWKPLHYAIRRIYSPILVSGYVDIETSTIFVHLTSDLRPDDTISGKVSMELHTFGARTAEPLAVRTVDVSMPGNDSRVVLNETVTGLLGHNISRADAFVVTKFVSDDGTASTSSPIWLSAFKDARIHPAKVSVESVTQGAKPHEVDVVLETNTTAVFVVVDALGTPGRFSDNGIFLLPNTPRTLTFIARDKKPVDLSAFAKTLKVRSLWDTIEGLQWQMDNDVTTPGKKGKAVQLMKAMGHHGMPTLRGSSTRWG